MRRALRLINEGALDEVSVGEFAARVGVGARHLDRLFLQHVGASPLAVAQTRRLHFAKRLIDESDLPMTQIALAAGFGSLRRFNDAFRNAYRRPPRELRRDRRGPPPRRAGDEVSLALSYRPPYDWDHLRNFLALRATPGVERVDEHSYGRLIRTDAGHAVIQVRPLAGKDALQLTRPGGAAHGALSDRHRRAARVRSLRRPGAPGRGTGVGPAAAPARAPAARHTHSGHVGRIRVRRARRVGSTSHRGGRAHSGRALVERVGEPVATAVTGLDRLFPTPRALAAANLDGLGLTGARIAALHALGLAVAEGGSHSTVPPTKSSRAWWSCRASANGRRSTLRCARLASPTLSLPPTSSCGAWPPEAAQPLTLKELERRADAWRPWRGYAVMHLWCAAGDRQLRGGDVDENPALYWHEIDAPIGRLLLAGDGDSLIQVCFQSGPRPQQPADDWIADGAPFRAAIEQLGEYFAGERRRFDLSLAPRGTEFQRRVWRALTEIPYGKTVSYGELARRIGKPSARGPSASPTARILCPSSCPATA